MALGTGVGGSRTRARDRIGMFSHDIELAKFSGGQHLFSNWSGGMLSNTDLSGMHLRPDLERSGGAQPSKVGGRTSPS
ncbi:hypothetical protein DSO57_1024296 [Entomophthora muscae]|uniref:Uncharacterized protein n=1 Tax=Entomophthora muscae TaxID=34485 RepID=A0ACC2SFJ4_9FUNG|nr:hypothetical protein DSO57_1024296 [Entomophthora muscae]